MHILIAADDPAISHAARFWVAWIMRQGFSLSLYRLTDIMTKFVRYGDENLTRPYYIEYSLVTDGQI